MEARFEELAAELEAEVRRFNGCLGAALLKPGEPGGDYQVVFRFTDPVSLRRWEQSEARCILLNRLDEVVLGTRVQRVMGVERFFDLPELAAPDEPKWRRHAGDILWVAPVAVVVGTVTAPLFVWLPPVGQVFATVTVMTVTLGELIGPVRRRIRKLRGSHAG